MASNNPQKRIYIVEEKDNPTTEYFIFPWIAEGSNGVTRCGFNDLPNESSLNGSIVIFVRYLPAKWRKLIQKNCHSLNGLYYFMDDDLLDFSATRGMPWRYRLKVYLQVTRYSDWLIQNNVQIKVSTSFLARKYQYLAPEVLSPFPIKKSPYPVRIFYHGSITHQADLEWLYPVVSQILQERPHVFFELIGNAKVNQRFRSLKRVRVVNLMSWDAYKEFIGLEGRHIGLVPLVDNAFNRARSHTKFFDITQAGAVGIYAKGSECADFVRNNVDGRVEPMEQSGWVKAILELVDSEEQRSRMVSEAVDRVNKLVPAKMDLDE